MGSDLPLFLVGGTVLGVGRGEEVYPLPDQGESVCVVALPEIGVSTPQAFRDWDEQQGLKPGVSGGFMGTAGTGQTPIPPPSVPAALPLGKLTLQDGSDRITLFGRRVSAWLSGLPQHTAGRVLSGVPGSRGRGRAGNPLLDLVRTGIENDFELVVFPKHPELREVKRTFERAGAFYASLSGSGSAIYGLFESRAAAKKTLGRLGKMGIPSVVTKTLGRQQYWKKWLV